MKSIVRSALGPTVIMIAGFWLFWSRTVSGIVETGGIDFLINGYDSYGRNLMLKSACFLAVLIPICCFFYIRALLPLAEMYILKNIVEKDVVLTACRTVDSAAYFPFMTCTRIRIAGEMGDFVLPYDAGSNYENVRVHIRYLPKSGLVLDLSRSLPAEKEIHNV